MHPLPLSTVTAAAVTPIMADLLGYQFEVASMLLAIVSCVIVRVYKGVKAKTREGWIVDGLVSLLTVLVTVGMVVSWRPNPLYAALLGAGIGAIGVGLITFAEKRALAALGEVDASPTANAGRTLRKVYPAAPEPDPDLIPGLTKLEQHD